MNVTLTHNFNEVFDEITKGFVDEDKRRAANVRALAITAHTEIKQISPELSGLFRMANILTIGEPSNVDPEQQGKEGNAAQEKAYEAEAQATLNTINTVKKPISIFLTNNKKYADRIEHGWSKQAASGVYGIVEARMKARIEREFK